MPPIKRRSAAIMAAAAVLPAGLLISSAATAAAAADRAAASARHQQSGYQVRQILDGSQLSHTFVPAGSATAQSEPLTQPDDVTALGHNLFTAFQNGVGAQGEPSSDGNTDSTIVEFTPTGQVTAQWDVQGKVDGLTADPFRHLVIATVNEDLNSSIYTVTPDDPAAAQVQHYQYNEPLPHNGGTDAITIYGGLVLVSASAPGTTGAAAPQPDYPAVYSVSFDAASHVATVTRLFSDEAQATVANKGTSEGAAVQLGLTDPDSSSAVPFSAPRFPGDFMLTSQGDLEQIFASPVSGLSVLRLSQSVDDTAWATRASGELIATDSSSDSVDAVTGHFRPGSVFVAVTPCNANSAPATCPAPGFPANYLGTVNEWTGQVSPVPVSQSSFQPKGMIFFAR
jgi:hypothetical protein